ncbi:hypothetical protein EDB81DRAFT_174409 [Dactylonectria macrodidyma]|uniref:Uncharacterized protein n=1 Tax=Dactylonectria macrodidyma TaxID=307937 RepID=A0A9P9JL96_9HYPO|nr:hypothetical protein EDB81DRAFT_174409 [Dactylonectria macrodidyma]
MVEGGAVYDLERLSSRADITLLTGYLGCPTGHWGGGAIRETRKTLKIPNGRRRREKIGHGGEEPAHQPGKLSREIPAEWASEPSSMGWVDTVVEAFGRLGIHSVSHSEAHESLLPFRSNSCWGPTWPTSNSPDRQPRRERPEHLDSLTAQNPTAKQPRAKHSVERCIEPTGWSALVRPAGFPRWLRRALSFQGLFKQKSKTRISMPCAMAPCRRHHHPLTAEVRLTHGSCLMLHLTLRAQCRVVSAGALPGPAWWVQAWMWALLAFSVLLYWLSSTSPSLSPVPLCWLSLVSVLALSVLARLAD